jgi:hypothetical protein
MQNQHNRICCSAPNTQKKLFNAYPPEISCLAFPASLPKTSQCQIPASASLTPAGSIPTWPGRRGEPGRASKASRRYRTSLTQFKNNNAKHVRPKPNLTVVHTHRYDHHCQCSAALFRPLNQSYQFNPPVFSSKSSTSPHPRHIHPSHPSAFPTLVISIHPSIHPFTRPIHSPSPSSSSTLHRPSFFPTRLRSPPLSRTPPHHTSNININIHIRMHI